MRVMNARNFRGDTFGGRHDLRFNAVEKSAGDVAGDLPPDMTDERRDDESGDRVSPLRTREYAEHSSHECLASAINVFELIRLPTRSL
jgi:hypothetical protein